MATNSGSLAQRVDHKLSDNGCSRHRMGSPARWIPHSRVMNQKPETMALKQERNVRLICRIETDGSSPPGCPHTVADRQPYTGSLHSEGGRHKAESSTGSDLPNSPDARRATDNPVSSLSPRQIQRDSRQTVKKKNSPRVEFTSFRYKRDLRKMGSIGHRSFHIS